MLNLYSQSSGIDVRVPHCVPKVPIPSWEYVHLIPDCSYSSQAAREVRDELCHRMWNRGKYVPWTIKGLKSILLQVNWCAVVSLAHANLQKSDLESHSPRMLRSRDLILDIVGGSMLLCLIAIANFVAGLPR